MKKILILIVTICVIFTLGCDSTNSNVNNSKVSNNENSLNSSQQVDSNSNKINSSNNSGNDSGNLEIENNPFFFNNNDSEVNYKGNFLFDNALKKDVKLHINKLLNFKDGQLYEFKLDAIDGVPKDRLDLGYFYVQKDKIIKIKPTEENLNILKESENIPSDSVIVCQGMESKDKLKEDEKGYHQYITINGDTVEYHSYNNQVSTGYYESFIWEKNKGLINYRSGYGAERDSIDLQIN